MLEAHFSGWGDNDGAYGTIEIDVAQGIAHLTHNARFMSVHTETAEV